MANYKNDPTKYYSCYSLKLKDFLIDNGCEFIENFKNLETQKWCWIFLHEEKLDKLLTEWSKKKNKVNLFDIDK